MNLPNHPLELKRILATSEETDERREAAAERLNELREDAARKRRMSDS